MGPKGWATYRTTQAAIQKTVNWFADGDHEALKRYQVREARPGDTAFKELISARQWPIAAPMPEDAPVTRASIAPHS